MICGYSWALFLESLFHHRNNIGMVAQYNNSTNNVLNSVDCIQKLTVVYKIARFNFLQRAVIKLSGNLNVFDFISFICSYQH